MLNMIKKMALKNRSTKFAGQSSILSGKVEFTSEMLKMVSGATPKVIVRPPKDKE